MSTGALKIHVKKATVQQTYIPKYIANDTTRILCMVHLAYLQVGATEFGGKISFVYSCISKQISIGFAEQKYNVETQGFLREISFLFV